MIPVGQWFVPPPWREIPRAREYLVNDMKWAVGFIKDTLGLSLSLTDGNEITPVSNNRISNDYFILFPVV